jgi:[ribosomal protein S5]-alanine N-acetyltransferase
MKLLEINSDGTLSANVGPLPEVCRSVIESTVGLYSRVGWNRPWVGYLAFENDECVGTCAFTHAPTDEVVEIAYFTLPGQEGRGVATRMAGNLLAIARTSAPDVMVTAHTLPQESASTRVLRKLGFVLNGPMLHPEDGTVWVWRHEEKRNVPEQSTNPAPSVGASDAERPASQS